MRHIPLVAALFMSGGFAASAQVPVDDGSLPRPGIEDLSPVTGATKRFEIEGSDGDLLYILDPKRNLRPVVLILPRIAGTQPRTTLYDTTNFPAYLSDKGYSVAWIEYSWRHPQGEEDLGPLLIKTLSQIGASGAKLGLDANRIILVGECDALRDVARSGLDPQFLGMANVQKLRALILIEGSCSPKRNQESLAATESTAALKPHIAPPMFMITVQSRSGTPTEGGRLAKELASAGDHVERLVVERTLWHSPSSRLGGHLNKEADEINEFLAKEGLAPDRPH